MNVYDFDKTIYKGDSTFDFYIFSFKRHKKIVKYFPSLTKAWFKFYILKNGTKRSFKEIMYSFLNECDIDKDVTDFWQTHEKNIKEWYLKQREDTDIIISASPEFLLSPICKKLNINLIASNVSKTNGKTLGPNCRDKEKVKRLNEKYPFAHIDKFYSDSYSDTPLAKLADKAFIVKGNKFIKWDFKKGKNYE